MPGADQATSDLLSRSYALGQTLCQSPSAWAGRARGSGHVTMGKHGLSRRGFMHSAVVGSAGLGLPLAGASLAEADAPQPQTSGAESAVAFDFTEQSAALSPDRTV